MADPLELSHLVRDDVRTALEAMDPMARVQVMRHAIRDAFMVAYDDLTASGEDASGAAEEFLGTMQNMMVLTHPDGSDEQVERIADIIGLAAANAAVVATNPGAEKTWRTMRDDRVRDLHQPMEGVTVASGDPFVVGGFPLQYPGQPVGPPEVWINCRCHLTTGATIASVDPRDTMLDALEAAVSEEPWSNFSASDYSLEQWRRACLIRMPDGDPESKSTYKVPVRTPSGALSRAGVHAAAAALAGARGGVDAPAAQKARARARLRSYYRQLGDDPPDSLRADGYDPTDDPEHAIIAAPGTHDGPGWLTNPRDTQRLRDYWTRGAGAGKIRWGQPGDFDRCRSQLRKYVSSPAYLAGTCANLHYVALGYWPNQGPHDSGKHGNYGHHASAYNPDDEETIAVTAAFTAAGADPGELPPAEWFQDPGFDAVTPLTITDDGRVMGHLAPWGTCHVGISGACTEAPHSTHNYAYFRTGELITDAGPVPVGQITMDTGHAATDLGASAAVSHYDDTGTVVADVAAGEDDYGIWVAGSVRPGLTDAQMRTLRAGALSGDWRRQGGNLELVAALVVNVPGFPIPRTQVASVGGQEFALTAAAVVTTDPNAVDADRVAIAVLAAMDQRAADKMRATRAEALAATITGLRVAALTAAGER